MDARQNDHVRPAVINVGCSSAAVKRSNSARTARLPILCWIPAPNANSVSVRCCRKKTFGGVHKPGKQSIVIFGIHWPPIDLGERHPSVADAMPRSVRRARLNWSEINEPLLRLRLAL
jgi:hypothetical protein